MNKHELELVIQCVQLAVKSSDDPLHAAALLSPIVDKLKKLTGEEDGNTDD